MTEGTNIMKNIKFDKFAYIIAMIACLSLGFLSLFGCDASAKVPNNSIASETTTVENINEYKGNIMLRVAVDDLGSIKYYVETRTGVMYCTKGAEAGLEEMHDPRTGKLLLYEDWVLYPTTYDKLYPVTDN